MSRSQRYLPHVPETIVVFLAAAWVGWAAFVKGSVSGWWLIAPVAAFLALLIYHDRVLRARELASRAVRYYERGLADPALEYLLVIVTRGDQDLGYRPFRSRRGVSALPRSQGSAGLGRWRSNSSEISSFWPVRLSAMSMRALPTCSLAIRRIWAKTN